MSCDGGVCSDAEDGFALDVSGAASGFAISFLLFLKLNFLGGSKLFLTSDSFSLKRLIVYTFLSASYPLLKLHFFWHMTHLAVRPLIVSRKIARGVLDIEGYSVYAGQAVVYCFIALAAGC